MTTNIRNLTGALGLILGAADGGKLPMPTSVVMTRDGRLDLAFDLPEHVVAWADWCGAEPITYQDADLPERVELGFGGERFEQPIQCHAPLMAVVKS